MKIKIKDMSNNSKIDKETPVQELVDAIEELNEQNKDAEAGCDGQEVEDANTEGAEIDRVAELEHKVAELTETISKDKDDFMRLMAEFDNYRRRTSQEKLELVNTASESTIKGLLPVLDDFERAIQALEQSEDSDSAKEGVNLIYNKMIAYLKTKGLTFIEAEGADFDTDLHEAVAQIPVAEEEKKGKVFDVVQTGYTLNGKVIRYAKVVVGI